MPRLTTLYGARPARASPLKVTVPEVGAMKPVSRLNSVVLPAPLGPRMPVSSPLLQREAYVLHGDEAAEAFGDVR